MEELIGGILVAVLVVAMLLMAIGIETPEDD